MTRSEREDGPDTWHHVMNRGIAKRTLFENELDIRTFLAGLACAVRARQIEVHAFCILTTHFHLLVRSPDGRLSEGLHHLQNGYSRWFNRSRKRDGPLFRGRFRSKRVDSLAYRYQLVHYIDANPVLAGLVDDLQLYPHGSARFYGETKGPIWLERSWVERVVAHAARVPEYRPADYRKLFATVPSEAVQRLIERRIVIQGPGADELDHLIGAAPPRVLSWMRRKALLADGTDVGLPVCDSAAVSATVAEARAHEGDWSITEPGFTHDAWPVIEVGLLRELCGVTQAAAAERTASSTSAVARRQAKHRTWLAENASYALRASSLAVRALRQTHGPGVDAALCRLSGEVR